MIIVSFSGWLILWILPSTRNCNDSTIFLVNKPSYAIVITTLFLFIQYIVTWQKELVMGEVCGKVCYTTDWFIWYYVLIIEV